VRRLALAAWALATAVVSSGSLVGGAAATPVPPGTSSCTYADTTRASVTASGSVLSGVEPGDVLSVTCSGLPASTAVVVDESSPLASVVSPTTLAVDERDATGAGTGVTDATGALSATSFTLPVNSTGGSGFAATDPNAACPPTQAQVDAGLLTCALVVSDAATGAALDEAQLVYATGEPTPAPPTLALVPATAANGDAVQVADASGAAGHWWGNAATSQSIPASHILVGTMPAASSGVTVSAATYVVASSTSNVPQWTTAVLNPPAIGGSFIVPGGVPAGSATVSVFEADASPAFAGESTNTSFPGDVSASASLSVLDTALATVSVDLAQGGDGSALVVTGSNWDPQGGPVIVEFSQSPTEPFSMIGTDTASAAVQSNGAFATVLLVGPTETTGLTGPDAVYVVAAQQAVTGGSPATIVASSPFTLEVGCAAGAAGSTCNLVLSLSSQVQGSLLSMAELPTAGNPSATDVTLSSVTLSGEFSDATGQMSTVLVNDDRGTLSGWTVTGQLEGPFVNASPQGPAVDNQFPADYLTWEPSVSLATAGSAPAPNGAAPGCPSGPSGPCPGPSGNLSEVTAGPAAALHDTTGTPVTLCSAASGGGGGSFECAAALVLAIPPQVALGTYQGTLDLVLIAL
jgi:hypothetical protein